MNGQETCIAHIRGVHKLLCRQAVPKPTASRRP